MKRALAPATCAFASFSTLLNRGNTLRTSPLMLLEIGLRPHLLFLSLQRAVAQPGFRQTIQNVPRIGPLGCRDCLFQLGTNLAAHTLSLYSRAQPCLSPIAQKQNCRQQSPPAAFGLTKLIEAGRSRPGSPSARGPR